MKTIKSLMVVAMLAVGIGATVMPNTASAAWSQAWEVNSVGPFDAIGMSWVSGGTFANPALTLDEVTPGVLSATDWTEISNAHDAFASFASDTDLLFTNHLLSVPGTFEFYVWNANTLVISALCEATELAVPTCSGGGSRERADQFTLSTPVPEPESYAMMLAGLGLMGFVARRPKQKETAA